MVLEDCPDFVGLEDWLGVAFFGPNCLTVPLIGGVWFAFWELPGIFLTDSSLFFDGLWSFGLFPG